MKIMKAMNILYHKIEVLVVLIFLLRPGTMDRIRTGEPQNYFLAFGQTKNDYVMFEHDMSEFETGFTVCSWVRKLRNVEVPTWFSYAVSDQAYEIQISDMGTRTRIFGDPSDLRTPYNVTPGTWFHNCLSWDSATSTRDVYIDGMRIDNKATPAGRTLGQGGTIVLGNEQQGVGTGMDTYNMFWGELFQLNIFTRKLNDSEIREMSEERCSEVEMKYGDERGLKWEDILQKTRHGNVTRNDVGAECKILIHVWKKWRDASRSESCYSHKKLNDSIFRVEIMNSRIKDELQSIKDESKEISDREC